METITFSNIHSYSTLQATKNMGIDAKLYSFVGLKVTLFKQSEGYGKPYSDLVGPNSKKPGQLICYLLLLNNKVEKQ